MPTVLLIAYYFPPIQEVGGFRTLRFAKFLPAYGWKPLVLTVSPDSVDERVDPGLIGEYPATVTVRHCKCFSPTKLYRQVAGGLRCTARRLVGAKDAHRHDLDCSDESKNAAVGRSEQPSTTTKKRWRRRLFEAIFCTPDSRVWWVPQAVWASWSMARAENPSMVYTSGPPHSTHLVGLLLHWLTGLPWVADFRDPWARAPWNDGVTSMWRKAVMSSLEGLCVRHSTAVVLNTDATAEEFVDHYAGLQPEKFVAIPNGYDPDLRAIVGQMRQAMRIGRHEQPFRLCHAGTLYGPRSLVPLIDAIGILARRGMNVELAQYGDCEETAIIRERIRTTGNEGRVVLHGSVPHFEALRQMECSDILVAIQPGTALEIPGKLYEMMLFDKPILVLADGGAAAQLVESRRLGNVAPSDNPPAIAEAIHSLCQTARDFGDTASRRCQVDEFDGRVLTGRLARLFDSISGPAKCPLTLE